MKIKYSPMKWNPYAKNRFAEYIKENTEIEIVNENTIRIDGIEYSFDNASITWPDVYEQTNGSILEAHRDETGELYLTVRRSYTDNCSEWDTGDYHDFNR